MSSYMTALSFADLSYVMPATAISYVVMTTALHLWLHEYVSPQRWAGVAFIVIGVGLVAGGPPRTRIRTQSPAPRTYGSTYEKPLYLALHLHYRLRRCRRRTSSSHSPCAASAISVTFAAVTDSFT